MERRGDHGVPLLLADQGGHGAGHLDTGHGYCEGRGVLTSGHGDVRERGVGHDVDPAGRGPRPRLPVGGARAQAAGGHQAQVEEQRQQRREEQVAAVQHRPQGEVLGTHGAALNTPYIHFVHRFYLRCCSELLDVLM